MTTNLDHNFTQALPNFDETSLDYDARQQISEVLAALDDGLDEPEPSTTTLDGILDATLHDEDVQELKPAILRVKCHSCEHPSCNERSGEPGCDVSLGSNPVSQFSWAQDGVLTLNNRQYIPNFNDTRLNILKARHDSVLGGHQGITKTTELVERDYIWKSLKRDVREYVTGCSDCQRFKTSRDKPHGLLRTLEIAERPWQHLSMDFIEPLPDSGGFNSILVVVDRLTKWSIFIPTTTRLTSPKLAQLIIDNVISQHGVPESIVSDRGSKFTSRFWGYVTSKLGVDLRLSTAYHPQTDGGLERMNQEVQAYLQNCLNHKQSDWAQWLPMAQLALNGRHQEGIGTSPFFATHCYQTPHPGDLPSPAGERL